MKQYIVEFAQNGARIHKDPKVIAVKRKQENVLLNPTLPKSVNPKYWFKDGGKIGIQRDQKIIKAVEEFNQKDDSENFEFLKLLLREEITDAERKLNAKLNLSLCLCVLAILLNLIKTVN